MPAIARGLEDAGSVADRDELDFEIVPEDAKNQWRGVVREPFRERVLPNYGRVLQSGKTEYLVQLAKEKTRLTNRDTCEVVRLEALGNHCEIWYTGEQNALAKTIVHYISSHPDLPLDASKLVSDTGFYKAISRIIKLWNWKDSSGGESVIDQAERLMRLSRSEQALDLIYDHVDACLRHQKLPELNQLLESAVVEELSVEILLGLLTASLPARTKLPARSAFFSKVENETKKRQLWDETLLAGLES